VLPEFIEAGSFPSTPCLGLTGWLGHDVREVGADESGNGLTMAFKTKTNFQFIGDELEVGRVLQGDKVLEKLADFRWPGWPMISAGKFGAELGTVL